MRLDAPFLYAFFIVFVRCSAMLLAAPVFGGAGLPVKIRVFISLAMAGSLAAVLHPQPGDLPTSLWAAGLAVANEAAIGLIIGTLVSLALTAAQMAGSLMDLQIGLSMSHVMNPATGTPSTILAQYKHMLAIVVFLCANGHHLLLGALARSFEAAPVFTFAHVQALHQSGLTLFGQMAMLSIQIAAPVAGVSILVDTAFGIVNKAVPQMPIFIVGMPAKILAGLVALSVSLPALTVAVRQGVEYGLDAVWRTLAGGS